jgi:PAS domain S-box-containing protein
MKKNTPSKIKNRQSLRVLIVEDSEDDALLIIRDLKKGGYNAAYKRVETAAAMKKALNEKQWDIILCDYKMPKFNAPSAIALLKEANVDIPLIIVSGTIGEDLAVECMRLGAHDYIMKDNLSRLCPAIARELEESEVRKKQRQAESQREAAFETLRENEIRYRELLDNMGRGVSVYETRNNGEDFIFKEYNAAAERFDNTPRVQAIGRSVVDVFPKVKDFGLFDVFQRVYRTGKPERHPVTFYKDEKISGWRENYVYKLPSGEIVAVFEDITQRKLAEEALRESEYKYKSLIENIPGIILTIDLEGTITFVSRRINEILGYEDSEMINMAIFNFIPEEDHQRAMESLRKGMKGEKIKHFQIPMTAKSGEKVFFENSFTRIYKDGAVVGAQGTAVDITERKHAESQREAALEALRLSEENFRRSLEDLPLGVRIVTVEGETIYANQAILDIYVHDSMEEFKTTPVENRYTPESFAEHQVRREKRKRGDNAPSEYEISIVRKDGEVRHLHVFRKDILWNGERQFQVLYNDITTRRQAEEQLHASLQEKELLLGEVHHRVKNNMQVISGLLDLPAALSGNQERRKMFHESQSRIHAMSLVHEKLYGSKDFARIDLAGYVKTLSQDLFQTYKIYPGKIDLIIQTDGDVYVDINKAIPCGLILNELISNALKHAFPGDRHGELQIIIRGMKNTEIEIVVRDNGLGLPDGVDIHQSLSVGLYLVKGLVKSQLDGKMEVRRDAGTEVRIKFPL